MTITVRTPPNAYRLREFDRETKRIHKKYIQVRKIGTKWNAFLQVDFQGFAVVEQTTRKRAIWFGWMLAAALARLVQEESGGGV